MQKNDPDIKQWRSHPTSLKLSDVPLSTANGSLIGDTLSHGVCADKCLITFIAFPILAFAQSENSFRFHYVDYMNL